MVVACFERTTGSPEYGECGLNLNRVEVSNTAGVEQGRQFCSCLAHFVVRVLASIWLERQKARSEA
jgi:hypothetical protein